MKNRLKRINKRLLALLLVFTLTLGLVTGANTKEVKAVAGVDDALIVVALLAMCGVAYTGINYAWHGGQGWVNDGDTEFPYGDVKEWGDGFNEKWQKQWDEDVKKEAKEKGLIDENDNIIGGGGSSGGGDDDDNKFPSWEKIKNLARNQKNIGVALSGLGLTKFASIFAYQVCKEANKYQQTNSNISSSNVASIQDSVKEYASTNNIDLSQYNSTLMWWDGYRYQQSASDGWYKEINIWYGTNAVYDAYYLTNEFYYVTDGNPGAYSAKKGTVKLYDDGRVKTEFVNYVSNSAAFSYKNTKWYFANIPYVQYAQTGKKEPTYITPATIGNNSALSDYLKENNNEYPEIPLYNNARVPADEEFAQYLKDLKDNKDDEEKRKNIVDDFIKKLTTETETPAPDPGGGETPTPTPDPDPTPGGGDSGGTDTPDTPSDDKSDNSNYTRDLKMLFPFCIPFDLVDCFKLFNAEPETPRVEVPMHFDIVDVDYTWVIDLKDFDGVATICRSMFLILFLIGLAFATSKVIKW